MNVVTDNTQVILNLEQENEQLKARIARLVENSKMLIAVLPHHNGVFVKDAIKDLMQVLNESPQQSLAEIQADAVEHFADVYSSTCNEEWYHSFASEYAEQLRNSVKDGE